MSGFINHLLHAHFNSGHFVQPRLRGAFESNSSFQHSPVTDSQPSFDANPDPGIQQETGKMPINQQAPRTPGAPAPIFKDANSNDEVISDQYKTDDSHLLISPSKAAKPDAMKNDSAALPPQQHEMNPLHAAEQLISPAVSQQKITTEYPGESEPFMHPTTTLADKTIADSTIADAAFISKKNTAFAPILSASPGERFDHQAPNNLVWLRAFKNMVNDQPQGNTSVTDSESVIKVNIGRIDVRAVTQQAPPRETAATRPGISLSDFLKNKNGNK